MIFFSLFWLSSGYCHGRLNKSRIFIISHIPASLGKKVAGFYTELEPGSPCVSLGSPMVMSHRHLRAETQHSGAQASFHTHEAMLVPSHGTSLWHWHSNLFLPWQHFLGECLHWAFRHAVVGQWELPCPPEEVISRTGNWTPYRLLYICPCPFPSRERAPGWRASRQCECESRSAKLCTYVRVLPSVNDNGQRPPTQSFQSSIYLFIYLFSFLIF